MNLFRIDTIARNNDLLILNGVRYNNNRFYIIVNRFHNIQPLQDYMYSNGTYYHISLYNQIDFDFMNINNLLWDHVNYNNNDFPCHIYGITENVYYYIKGLILT
jgi:hypothetical protein